MKRVLMTGAGGNLGSALREHLHGLAEVFRLSDIAPLDIKADGEEFVQCDLSDFDAVLKLVEDCDGIIHLGGIPTENTFENILNGNIRGTYNLYEAARRQGVPRILFASSNHVVGFHERETLLDANAPMRPDSLYGVSKGFGELLARFYYDKFGVESACVRIGSCFEKPRNRRMLATWLSIDDFAALIQRVFTADRLGCPVIYGVSDNPWRWWDNRQCAYLGWQPKDSSARFLDEPGLRDERVDPRDPAVRYQGGSLVSLGHFDDSN